MKSFVSSFVILCLSSLFAHGIVLFHDDFELAPSTAGATGRTGSSVAWTESTASWLVATTVSGETVATDDPAAGSTSGTGTASITRTIDTSGYTSILLELSAFQGGANDFETMEDRSLLTPAWSDYLEIAFDDGSGETRLLLDHGAWEGIDDPAVASWGGEAANTTPTSTGSLALPASAADNSSLTITLRRRDNNAGEIYYLNSMTVSGTVIPEPSAGLLLLVGLGGFLLLRRR